MRTPSEYEISKLRAAAVLSLRRRWWLVVIAIGAGLAVSAVLAHSEYWIVRRLDGLFLLVVPVSIILDGMRSQSKDDRRN